MQNSPSSIQPMVDLFASILTRLDALESTSGITPSSNTARELSALKQETRAAQAKIVKSGTAGGAESVEAYDMYVKSHVVPLSEACDALDGKLKNMGQLILDAWDGIRTIIVLASKSKKPKEVAAALAPHLQKTQVAMKEITSLRLHRDYDFHYKGIKEMIMCVSWVVMAAPDNNPSAFVKESLGASEFWLNRIRKEFKGKDAKQIAFCDAVKSAALQLSVYIEKYHKKELSWNPQGVDLSEAAASVGSDNDKPKTASQKPKAALPSANAFMQELAKKRSADGSSAATGLKKVTKDQQTWRKEFNASDNKPVEKSKKKFVAPPIKKPMGGAGKVGTPLFEYQNRGFRWAIEHQTEQSVKENHNGMITVNINDPKEQVYLFKCTGITVKIVSKFKAVVIENCTKCNVIFETLISGLEIVNSKRIQVQTSGTCPVFTIDKTNGCTIYLSEESKNLSSFVTSESSEMNISFPDGDEQKELPIPQQFVHKLVDGKVTSEVSSLYTH